MNKEDKVKAVQFLNETGAFLITKSGDRVCKFFGISKYTLYSYMNPRRETPQTQTFKCLLCLLLKTERLQTQFAAALVLPIKR